MDQATEGSPVIIVAILTLRTGASQSFREFETKAARIMSRYGGVIERSVVVEPLAPREPAREVHVVTFPDPDAFANYRIDPDLAALAGLRLASIAHTEVLIGRKGPDYSELARSFTL